MIRRAYEICSNEEEKEKELTHLKKVFTEINGYPVSLVEKTLQKVKDERLRPVNKDNKNEEENDIKTLMIKMPYAGDKGESIIKDLNRTLKNTLPNNIRCRVVRTGTKIERKFNIKDKLEDQHKSNFVYQHQCKNKNCKEDYVGETGRTLALRFSDHRGYVRNEKFDKPTGEHFNLPGHKLADMKISIVEKVLSSDPNMRKIRESHFIEKLNTFYKGMNKKK